ncbi:gallinacin-1 alpha-like isoform 1-T1 [Guaruba guarouba]
MKLQVVQQAGSSQNAPRIHEKLQLLPCEDPSQASAMRILYLLFPLFLLLAQGAAGSSLAPGNRAQCHREKGFCALLKCPFLYVVSGRCTKLTFCCKKIWG